MAFSLSKTRLSPIAIDFGADSLKLLQVVPNEPPQIVAAAAAVVPDEARSNPAARQAFYQESLKTMLRLGGFKGRRAICSIPAYQTLIQHVSIPRSEQDDVEAQVCQHLRQRFNLNPSRLVIRTFCVGQVMRDGGTKQEVICLAASRETVMRHIQIANRAKLDVVGMQGEPVAILKAFEHLYRRKTDQELTTCFIDIGSATTKVVIAHGGELAFAKAIHAAGDHLTRHLAQSASMSFADARQARIAKATTLESGQAAESVDPTVVSAAAARGGGVATLDGDGAAAQPLAPIPAPGERRDPTASAIAVVAPQIQGKADETSGAADTIDCLIDDLQLCIRYHQTSFPDQPINKLVFLGGESRHVATCQKIARALRIGAQLGDPLARTTRSGFAAAPIGVDMRQPQPGWAVTLGLCLSEANL